ncbi:MAG: hypothetical protein ACI8QZ_002878 [Chlamydiales bacterium]|jgi:hypothetical protein
MRLPDGAHEVPEETSVRWRILTVPVSALAGSGDIRVAYLENDAFMYANVSKRFVPNDTGDLQARGSFILGLLSAPSGFSGDRLFSVDYLKERDTRVTYVDRQTVEKAAIAAGLLFEDDVFDVRRPRLGATDILTDGLIVALFAGGMVSFRHKRRKRKEDARRRRRRTGPRTSTTTTEKPKG